MLPNNLPIAGQKDLWAYHACRRQGSYSNEADPTWTPLVVTPFHPGPCTCMTPFLILKIPVP